MSPPTNTLPPAAVASPSYHLRHTNGEYDAEYSVLIRPPYNASNTHSSLLPVSNPSVVHPKSSQQSIAASEDYYSLSASSQSSRHTIRGLDDHHSLASHPITRYTTPPSRYRTPAQSASHLPIDSRDDVTENAPQDDHPDLAAFEEVRKTPMRGQGKRRSTSAQYDVEEPVAPITLREGGIRRKPVPSAVVESPRSFDHIDHTNSRSSIAADLDRQFGAISPDQDDAPFIHFALDQLTRDEEVRGSRQYPGQQEIDGQQSHHHSAVQSSRATNAPRHEEAAQAEMGPHPPALTRTQQWPEPSRAFDEPAPRNPKYASEGTSHSRDGREGGQQLSTTHGDPDPFIALPKEDGHLPPLKFVPGILRPLSLGLFVLVVAGMLVVLLLAAIGSLLRDGLVDYRYFGGPWYFLFQYLPPMLGVIVFFWLVQIQVAVYRIAPFIAMASRDSSRAREEGARLTLSPRTFLLPHFGHFKARLPVIGVFMFVAWLQIWTLPLLGSCFNVFFFGSPESGGWRWVATQAVIWTTIALYLCLLVATLVLLIFMAKAETGLRWDPRSLADIITLLERSNALTTTEDEQIRHEAPRLGYWKTARGGHPFHTYGVERKPARMYGVDTDGLIREKQYQPPPPDPSQSRWSSDNDVHLSREQRNSREKMRPKHISTDEEECGGVGGARALPWFLRPAATILWGVAAVVLYVAFLLASYLPLTLVTAGFPPAVPTPVGVQGFSASNFLYSFIPGVLATVAFLGWLDFDYAYRRLQPLAALVPDEDACSSTSISSANSSLELGHHQPPHTTSGAPASHSLLTSYVADLPFVATISALANHHFRPALTSFCSLLFTALPVLASAVFWTQYYRSTASIRITPHTPGYALLTAILAIYTLACVTLLYPSRRFRALRRALPSAAADATSFADISALLRGSRLLDDACFRAPASKPHLVARLLSAAPVGVEAPGKASRAGAGGGARARGDDEDVVPRFALGVWRGRNGEAFGGLERVGRVGA